MNQSPPRVVPFSGLTFQPRFEYGDMAEVTGISGPEDMTELGTGFGRLINADIPWTIKYDEVILVLEGSLTVVTDAGELNAGPKDCIWLPKGTALRYRAKDALLFFAITPANWAAEP